MKQVFVKKLFRDTFEQKSEEAGSVGFTLKVTSYCTQTTYYLDSEMKAITTGRASSSDRRSEMLAELLWETPLKNAHVKVIFKSRWCGIDVDKALPMTSRCDTWRVKGKQKPSTTTEFILVSLLAACFGFSKKPSPSN
jgi:hypothetical protein